MADFITHHIAGELYINEERQEITEIIKKNRAVFNWGTQGPDIFFFYKFLRRNNKRFVSLARQIHKSDVNALFYALQKSILNCDGEEKELLLSYFFGFVTHYQADHKIHPYIAAMVKEEKRKGSKQSISAIHVTKEHQIGCAYSHKKFDEGLKKVRLKKQYKVSKQDCLLLQKMWEPVLEELYGFKIRKGALYKSVKACFFLSRPLYFANEFVRAILKFVEKLINFGGRFKSTKHSVNILNLNNNVWQHPMREENYSVENLMDIIIKESISLNSNVLYAQKSGQIIVTEYIGNFNYGFNTDQAQNEQARFGRT